MNKLSHTIYWKSPYIRLYNVDIPKEKMVELFAYSGDPDQIVHSAGLSLGLHCLPVTRSGISRLQWVNQANKSFDTEKYTNNQDEIAAAQNDLILNVHEDTSCLMQRSIEVMDSVGNPRDQMTEVDVFRISLFIPNGICSKKSAEYAENQALSGGVSAILQSGLILENI